VRPEISTHIVIPLIKSESDQNTVYKIGMTGPLKFLQTSVTQNLKTFSELKKLNAAYPQIWVVNGRPHLSTDAHPLKATYDDDFIHFSKILQPGVFEEARRFYESGLSLQQTAERLKRSKAFVRDTLIKGGVTLRPGLHTPEGKIVRKQRRMAGPAPYGFTYLRGQLVIHPLEIEHALGILDSWKKGRSARSIAMQLNESSVLSKKGKQWDHSSVLKVIKLHEKSPELISSVSGAAGLLPSRNRVQTGAVIEP